MCYARKAVVSKVIVPNPARRESRLLMSKPSQSIGSEQWGGLSSVFDFWAFWSSTIVLGIARRQHTVSHDEFWRLTNPNCRDYRLRCSANLFVLLTFEAAWLSFGGCKKLRKTFMYCISAGVRRFGGIPGASSKQTAFRNLRFTWCCSPMRTLFHLFVPTSSVLSPHVSTFA